MTEYAITPEFRCSWPKVFSPELNKLSGKMEYTIDALFPKGTDLSALKALAFKACVEEWGPDQSKWPQAPQLNPDGTPVLVNGVPVMLSAIRTPFRDGSERIVKDKNTGQVLRGADGLPQLQPGFERGATFIKLKTTQKPGVVGPDNQPILDATQVYGGCKMRAQVHAFAYAQKGNYGVSIGLDNLQKTADDEPLSGRVKAENAFTPVVPPAGAAGTPATAASIFG